MPYTFDMSTVPKTVSDFASYKSVIQGCSAKTVEEYVTDLRMFFRYILLTRNGARAADLTDELLEQTDISALTLDFVCSVKTEEIYEFFMYVGQVRQNSTNAKARKLSAIKALYKHLVLKRGVLEVNPAENIESPKKKKSLPKHLTLEESLSLLGTVANDKASKNRLRDYAILTLFLNCGMRLSELVGINLSDMDPALRSLRVLGKGNKERIIYLNEACREALVPYLERRRADTTVQKKTDALFLSSRGQRMSNKTVQWMVYKYLSAAGLDYKHYSTHKLRHTAATLMYQTGKVDVRVLKEILGHEQLNTTQIYTHVSGEGIERAMAENPLASVKPKNE